MSVKSLDKQMDTVVVPGLQFARKVYVLKRVNDVELGRQRFVGTTEEETETLLTAKQFPSRLAARGYTINRDKVEGFVAADWEYVQIELVPEPEKIEVVDGLMIDDPIECIERVCELHAMYSERVASWVRLATNIIADYSAPRVVITARPQLRWTGLYSPGDHTCHYVLPHAMLNLGRQPKTAIDYEETIAHEVVHAYQKIFVGQYVHNGHGGDFYAMMRHAALYPTTVHTHAGSSSEMKKCVALFKKLQKPLERMAIEGRLIGLPCQVVTERIERKGMQ